MTPWTPEQVCDYYDSHPNITLSELSMRAMRPVSDLKRILQGMSG